MSTIDYFIKTSRVFQKNLWS